MPPEPVLAVPVRLTRAEMEIICRGLNPIGRDYQLWKERGYGTFPYLIGRENISIQCTDELIYQQAGVVTKVHGLIYGNFQTTKRLRLNAIELAACEFGIRVVAYCNRHKKVQWKRRNHRATMEHLRRKIQNARRVARSTHIKARGEADYISARDGWQTYLAWMREVFAYAFFLHSKRLPSVRNTIRNLVMKDWVMWVRQALSNLELDPMPDAEIVRELRQALSAAHRAGIGFGVLDPRQRTSRTEWLINELI